MGAELDRAIAGLAGMQHGVVTRRQLEAIGVGRGAIGARVRAGRLHRLHRGVYAVGHHSPSDHQRYMAAVLACGAGAALSHQSAAYLYGFLKPEGGSVHVTSPSTAGKALRAGIVLHRSPSLEKGGQATRRERIPVTAPRRTIEDLEGTVEPYLYRRAKGQAEFMKYRLGLPTDRTRSDLERDFLRFLKKHGFPPAQVNVKAGKYRVDFLWPEQMVAVETDFFDYHRGSVAFEDDRQRDMELRLMGYAVRRYTGDQLRDHPALVVADLGEVLRRESRPSR
jgi:very-short-patch-repair endonuclease